MCHQHYKKYDIINRKDAINRVSTECVSTGGGITGEHNPMGKNIVGEIIRWYKGRCKYELRNSYPYFRWQPRFYDRVIRNLLELNKIRQYVIDNPAKWKYEKNRTENIFY